jgi:hypothetical protein
MGAEGVGRWAKKYAEVCGLSARGKEISTLGEVLFEAMKIRFSSSIPAAKRLDFLEQDTMAKAIIIIFIKLEVGFQKEPYLSSFAPELISRLKLLEVKGERTENIGKYIELMEQIMAKREKNISIISIIEKLHSYFTDPERVYRLKNCYSIDNYSAL